MSGDPRAMCPLAGIYLRLEVLHLLFPTFFLKFIYFGLHWVFVAVRGLSLFAMSAGFSLRWLLLLRSMGSRCPGLVVVALGL